MNIHKYNKKDTISLQYLESQDLGSHFVQRMLNIYIEDIPQQLRALTSNLNQNDFKNARIALHTLNSHIRDLGLTQLHNELSTIEDLKFNEIAINEIHTFILHLSEHCDQVITQLKEKIVEK